MQRFDIEAHVPVSLRLDAQDLATQKRTIQQLVRELLADRFGLVLRDRTERVPVYALSVAKGGPKIQRAAAGGCVLDTGPGGCHSFAPGFGHPLNAKAVDMPDLAHYLRNWADLPVVDHTGLAGLFTLHTRGWRPMNLPPPPGMAGSGDEFARLPPLAEVLESIGLKLQRQEESLTFYKVERLRMPNGN